MYCLASIAAPDDDLFDDEITNDETNEEEHFQVQSSGDNDKFVLVNTRIDYQYRSNILNKICLYDFVSTLYKKKMNESDMKYLSKTAITEEKTDRKGRPPNQRYTFQEQHPQAKTYLMMKYSEPRVPILYGPQIPRQDREDTKERYSRAVLTLFVPWRIVSDICDVNQKWEEALKSRQHLISTHSQKIIDNIQLLHECKKDRDEHLLQVIAEAQTESDAIDPELLPANQDIYDEYDSEDNEDLLALLGNLDEYTIATANAARKSTEKTYIEETIEAVENVGRFTHTHSKYNFNTMNRIKKNDETLF